MPLLKGSRKLWAMLVVLAALGVLAYELVVLPGQSSRQSIDVPAIGGAFAMVDQNGDPFTQEDLEGHFSLIYFGYTYCPDICPTELTIIADALDLLGEAGRQVTPIFVTVDPERDTVEQMKMYVHHFHPRLVGLTGSVEQVAAMAKAYRVYYAKVPEAGATSKDDYLMDHTAVVYLMDPDGRFRAHFPHGTDPQAMAAKIRSYF